MSRNFLSTAAVLSILLGIADCASAQQEQVRDEITTIGKFKSPEIIAAKVDGHDIDAGEINRLVALSLRGRPVTADAVPGLQAQALEQLVDRELIMHYLDQQKVVVTKEEVDKEIEARAKKANLQGGDLSTELARIGHSMAGFRRDVEWDLRWEKYANQAIDDAALETYFNEHRGQFDGGEIRVSHILLRPAGRDADAETDALIARAEEIRKEIVDGGLKFSEAAAKYSAGPSRRNGGDLGYIQRTGVMPEDFSQAAFALNRGEVSQPVKSTAGVHLIQCTEVRPGAKSWRDVRRELRIAVMQQNFKRVADAERKDVPVEYTGAMPYLDPESHELVRAKDDPAAAAPSAEAPKSE